jgi:hypothetical protein
MKGLIMLLKGFGLSQQDIDRVVAFIPTVPTIVQQGTEAINKSLKNFDTRLKTLEETQRENNRLLEELINGLRSRQLQQSDSAGESSAGDIFRNARIG